MNNSLGNTGRLFGSGNRVGPGINHKLIDMPGVNDKKSKSSILPISNKREFKTGEMIQGFDVDNEETITGEIIGFEHGDDNEIIYYYILDDKNTERRIDASNVEDWNVNEKKHIVLKLKESVLYKSVSNTILSYGEWIKNI